MSGGAATKPEGSPVSRTAPLGPTRLKGRLERRVVSLRVNRGLGPAHIAGIMGPHTSTTHRVLVCHVLNRLVHVDRLTPSSDPGH